MCEHWRVSPGVSSGRASEMGRSYNGAFKRPDETTLPRKSSVSNYTEVFHASMEEGR